MVNVSEYKNLILVDGNGDGIFDINNLDDSVLDQSGRALTSSQALAIDSALEDKFYFVDSEGSWIAENWQQNSNEIALGYSSGPLPIQTPTQTGVHPGLRALGWAALVGGAIWIGTRVFGDPEEEILPELTPGLKVVPEEEYFIVYANADADEAPPAEELNEAEEVDGDEGMSVDEAVEAFEESLAAILSGDLTAYTRLHDATEVLDKDHKESGRGSDTALSQVVERNLADLEQLHERWPSQETRPYGYLLQIFLQRREELWQEIEATDNNEEILRLYDLLDPLLPDGPGFNFQSAERWQKIYRALSSDLQRMPDLARHLCRAFPIVEEAVETIGGMSREVADSYMETILPSLMLLGFFDAAENLQMHYHDIYGHDYVMDYQFIRETLVPNLSRFIDMAAGSGDFDKAAGYYMQILYALYHHIHALPDTFLEDSAELVALLRTNDVNAESLAEIDRLHAEYERIFRERNEAFIDMIRSLFDGRDIPEEKLPDLIMAILPQVTDTGITDRLATQLCQYAEDLYEAYGNAEGALRARTAREALGLDTVSDDDRAAFDAQIQEALSGIMVQSGTSDEEL